MESQVPCIQCFRVAVVKKRYKFRATRYSACSKHVEAVHMTVCQSLISCFWKTTVAMQASYSQGLTCIKSHNTNPYTSQKHAKTTKNAALLSLRLAPGLACPNLTAPEQGYPAGYHARHTNHDTSKQLSIYTYIQIQMVVSTLVYKHLACKKEYTVI